MLVAFRKLAHNLESSSMCCWFITISLVFQAATHKHRYPSLPDTVMSHLGGGGLGGDLGNDLLAIPLDVLAMLGIFEKKVYLLVEANAGRGSTVAAALAGPHTHNFSLHLLVLNNQCNVSQIAGVEQPEECQS